MAKVTAPAPKQPEQPEIVINYGELTQTIAERQTIVIESEQQSEAGNIECALDAREFRENNPEAERKFIVLAIATGVAEPRGLKPDDIMTAPDKTLNSPTATSAQKEKYARLKYANELQSRMAGVAWPKDPDAEKRVKRLIEQGERGFVKLVTAAAKKQKNPHTPPDPANAKVTKDTFGTKLGLFLSKCTTDIEDTTPEEIAGMADVAIEAWLKASTPPPAE